MRRGRREDKKDDKDEGDGHDDDGDDDDDSDDENNSDDNGDDDGDDDEDGDGVAGFRVSVIFADPGVGSGKDIIYFLRSVSSCTWWSFAYP